VTGSKRTLAAMSFVALLCAATATPAQTRKEIREDRKEKREDRKEAREDKKELREDKKELREDKKDGADAKELAGDRKDIREDKKDLAGDKRDLRKDRRELRADRKEKRKERLKEIKAKWGDLVKRPDAQAELEVHARRIARLERAKTIATEDKKTVLVGKIDKLIEKEKARHQRTMDRLKTTPAPGGTP